MCEITVDEQQDNICIRIPQCLYNVCDLVLPCLVTVRGSSLADFMVD